MQCVYIGHNMSSESVQGCCRIVSLSHARTVLLVLWSLGPIPPCGLPWVALHLESAGLEGLLPTPPQPIAPSAGVNAAAAR